MSQVTIFNFNKAVQIQQPNTIKLIDKVSQGSWKMVRAVCLLQRCRRSRGLMLSWNVETV